MSVLVNTVLPCERLSEFKPREAAKEPQWR